MLGDQGMLYAKPMLATGVKTHSVVFVVCERLPRRRKSDYCSPGLVVGLGTVHDHQASFVASVLTQRRNWLASGVTAS